jgi:hypothetical protein
MFDSFKDNAVYGSNGKYIFLGLLLGIVVTVLLLVTDAFFPFLPINPMGGPSPAARSGKTFWKTLPPDAENLIVPSKLSPTKLSASYTMSIQMIVGDSRNPGKGKYRHILHRGSNPCNLSNTTAGPSGQSGISMNKLPESTESTYRNQGLPAVMNPGLFLDSYKNDLHIFTHTRNIDGNLMLESTTIEDLPIHTPLSISIVSRDKILEIYINCKLYNTKILTGTPYLPPELNTWYGRYCANPFAGLVKNLQLWNTHLSSDDVIAMCKKGGFKGDSLPSGCASSTIS